MQLQTGGVGGRGRSSRRRAAATAPVGLRAVHSWSVVTVRGAAEGEREMQHDDAVGEDIHEEEANMYREHVVSQVCCLPLTVFPENMRLQAFVPWQCHPLGTQVSSALCPTCSTCPCLSLLPGEPGTGRRRRSVSTFVLSGALW